MRFHSGPVPEYAVDYFVQRFAYDVTDLDSGQVVFSSDQGEEHGPLVNRAAASEIDGFSSLHGMRSADGHVRETLLL